LIRLRLQVEVQSLINQIQCYDEAADDEKAIKNTYSHNGNTLRSAATIEKQ